MTGKPDNRDARDPSGLPELLWHGNSELSLQDIGEIQLLLRGQSVIDWHRLALTSDEDVRRLLSLNSLDLDDAGDRERLAELRQQAVRYIVEVLKLRLDETLAEKLPWSQIPLLASGKSIFNCLGRLKVVVTTKNNSNTKITSINDVRLRKTSSRATPPALRRNFTLYPPR